MSILGSMSLTRDQLEVEQAQARAIENRGYRFIELRLTDSRFRKIQGAKDVRVTQNISASDPNAEQFSFEIIGRSVEFRPDPYHGGMVLRLLDDPEGHNREFLASHRYSEMWTIVDERIDKEIIALSAKMKSKILRDVAPAMSGPTGEEPSEGPEPQTVTVLDSDRSVDDIDLEIMRLTELKKRNTPVMQQEGSVVEPTIAEPTVAEQKPVVADRDMSVAQGEGETASEPVEPEPKPKRRGRRPRSETVATAAQQQIPDGVPTMIEEVPSSENG